MVGYNFYGIFCYLRAFSIDTVPVPRVLIKSDERERFRFIIAIILVDC